MMLIYRKTNKIFWHQCLWICLSSLHVSDLFSYAQILDSVILLKNTGLTAGEKGNILIWSMLATGGTAFKFYESFSKIHASICPNLQLLRVVSDLAWPMAAMVVSFKQCLLLLLRFESLFSHLSFIHLHI